MQTTSKFLCLIVLFSVVELSLQHAKLDYPTPRTDSSSLKSGPCGGVPPGFKTPLVGGSNLTVTWTETVDHTGWWRIAMSKLSGNDFDDNLLLPTLDDPSDTDGPHQYTVVVPNMDCSDCVLQLIQVMGSWPNNYYSCADISITANSSLPTYEYTVDNATSTSGTTGTTGRKASTTYGYSGAAMNLAPSVLAAFMCILTFYLF